MRTRLLVGLLAFTACGYAAAQGGSAAAPSTAETPSAQQPPTERQPTDTPAGQAQPASQGSPNPAADSPMAPATATQGDPTAQPTATVSPNPTPTAAPATAITAVTDFGATKPGDPAAGEQKASVCGACHGIDGNSADAQYPKLAGQNELYTARQLALYKSGERVNPIMQGMAAPLSAQDMRDLGAFFATKNVKAGLASDEPVAEGAEETWAQRGASLYRGGNANNGTPACMACHGPTGRGNPGARYPAVAGQHADYTKAQLIAFRSGEIRGKDRNANAVMAAVAAQLSDQDIEALSTYIEGLHRRPVESMPASGAPSAVAAAPTATASAAAAPAATAPAADAATAAPTTTAPAASTPAADAPATAESNEAAEPADETNGTN